MAPGVLAITGELLDAVGEPLPYGVGALAWIGAYRLFDDQRIRVVAAVMGFLVGLVLAALP
jgi:hypothetical protein